MGVSYVVKVIRGPSDERWAPMFAALKACRAAGVEPPGEVVEYFQLQYPGEPCEDPAEDGVEVGTVLVDMVGEDDVPWYSTWENKVESGVTVHLDRLPAGSTALRVYMS